MWFETLKFDMERALLVIAFDLDLNIKVTYWPKFGTKADFWCCGSSGRCKAKHAKVVPLTLTEKMRSQNHIIGWASC